MEEPLGPEAIRVNKDGSPPVGQVDPDPNRRPIRQPPPADLDVGRCFPHGKWNVRAKSQDFLADGVQKRPTTDLPRRVARTISASGITQASLRSRRAENPVECML